MKSLGRFRFFSTNYTLLMVLILATSCQVDNTLKGTIGSGDGASPSVTFSQNTQSATEDAGNTLINVSLSKTSKSEVIIPLIVGGTATAVTDYTLTSSTLTIAAGQTTGNVTIILVNDSNYELPDETITLAMGVLINATAGAISSHTLYITNDDLSAFTITGVTGGSDATTDQYLIDTLNPTINWNASAAAITYDVTIFENDGSTVKCTMATENSPATSHNFSSCNLANATNYKAKVTAKTAGGTQSLDASNSFFSFSTNRNPIANNDGPIYVMKDSAAPISLSVLADNPASGAIDPDTDPDGDLIGILSVSDPSGGTAVINGTNIDYTPDAGFTGTDSFTYTITDSKGGTATGTVNLRVVTPHTWTGNAGTTNWSTISNWCGSINNPTRTACLGGSIPISTDTAIFDGTCAANCSATTTANVTVANLYLNSGYVGTFTQGAGFTLTVGGLFSQSAGTFVGGNANFTIYNIFNLTGGTFTAPSAVMRIEPNLVNNQTMMLITSAATFNHNNGTVHFLLSENTCTPILEKIDVPNNMQFYNFGGATGTGMCGASLNVIYIEGNRTIIVNNEFQQGGVYQRWDNGNIDLYGNLKVWYTALHGGGNHTTTVTFKGTANQTYDSNTFPCGGVQHMPIVIDKTAGTVLPVTNDPYCPNGITILQGSFTAPDTGALEIRKTGLTLNGGVFNSGTGAVIIRDGSLTLNAGTLNSTVAIEVQKDVVVGAGFSGTTAPISFTGAYLQTYTNASSAPFTSGDITVNKTAGSLTLANHLDLNSANQDLIVTAGTILMSGFNLVINNTLTMSSASSIITKSSGVLSVGAVPIADGPYGSGTVNP